MFRRFSIDPADKKSHIFRRDKSSGRNRRVNPVNEAVVGHYYRLVDEDGAVDNTADELLDHFETKAADVIRQLGDPTHRPDARGRVLAHAVHRRAQAANAPRPGRPSRH